MDPDQGIARLAESQHGLVTRAQALAKGLTDEGIRRRVMRKRFERLHPGVYRLAGSRRTWEQVAKAASLAGGPDALISHRAAAALQGLSVPDRRIHVTVVRPRDPQIAGAAIHRVSSLPAEDTARCRGIPVTRSPGP